MTSLRELEQRCYRAFLLDETEPLLPLVVSGTIPAAARVAVYQNNARELFRKTLASSYPVIERLVGEACFRSLARKYMREQPSQSGDLQHFGRGFAAFLHDEYAATEFAYLPDVARLEWAVEEVLLAPQPGRALELSSLDTVPAEQHANIAFELGESVRLVGSRYPVFDIWRANQAGAESAVDLATGAQHVVVRRNGVHADIEPMEPAAFELAAALSRGAVLGEAFDGLAPDRRAELGAMLGVLLERGLLGGFRIRS